MRYRPMLALAASALVWFAIPSTPAAAGGGGCHAAMTQGEGDAIVIRDGCFTPGILRVAPGATVTFSNRDPYLHNVSANGWGSLDGLDQGDGFTAVFAEPGVYPFACTYHPSMTGAVVVGDGTGAGNGAVVEVGPPDVSEEAPTPADVQPVATTRQVDGSVGWVLAGAGGLALGLAAGVVAGRRRARA